MLEDFARERSCCRYIHMVSCHNITSRAVSVPLFTLKQYAGVSSLRHLNGQKKTEGCKTGRLQAGTGIPVRTSLTQAARLSFVKPSSLHADPPSTGLPLWLPCLGWVSAQTRGSAVTDGRHRFEACWE